MKQLISLSSIWIFILLFVFSCDKELDRVDQEDTPISYQESDNLVKNGIAKRSTVEFYCTSNPCDNGQGQCQVETDLNGKFSCTCSGCKMTVTGEWLDNHNNYESILYENNSYNDAVSFMRRKHGIEVNGFDDVSVSIDENRVIFLYSYKLQSGRTETVMYVKEYNNLLEKRIDRTIEIDCTGDCDCREEWDFNTGKASCSCSDCKMTVTVIDK